LTTFAQTPLAPPPQLPYGLSVSTESAKNAAAAAIAEARNNNWQMAIAIVDTGGYLTLQEQLTENLRYASWQGFHTLRLTQMGATWVKIVPLVMKTRPLDVPLPLMHAPLPCVILVSPFLPQDQ
jgi:hypothetical protein